MFGFPLLLCFVFLINKFDFKTPGRTQDLSSGDSPNPKSSEFKESYATKVIIGLGGASNIVELDCCATRLRITVKDALKVSEKILKKNWL